ncbi:MAG: 16S rRNA (uracil(1498)-N(3))-methyltransferase [Prevotella sp.]|nr:16S rRNA (uracil(1498)-N(3))-methyltransferase [Prevotella sp.]
MKEERYFYVPCAATLTELPQEEAQHAIKVLRLREGDTIFLMDGKGTFYRAEVSMVSNKHCAYDIIETIPQERPWQNHLHIVMAPTKMMERTEWMAEKATEIGIDEFSFLECQFSERRILRSDRIDKIVVSATKQSRKAWKPVVNDMQSFRSFVEQPRKGLKFICHCYNEIERKDLFDTLNTLDSSESTEPVTVLVGPEGDFSLDEVRLAMQHGYISTSLGSQRLRTETAALSAVMIMQLSQRL